MYSLNLHKFDMSQIHQPGTKLNSKLQSMCKTANISHIGT